MFSRYIFVNDETTFFSKSKMTKNLLLISEQVYLDYFIHCYVTLISEFECTEPYPLKQVSRPYLSMLTIKTDRSD